MGMRRAEKSSRNLDLGNLDAFALSVFLSENAFWGFNYCPPIARLDRPQPDRSV